MMKSIVVPIAMLIAGRVLAQTALPVLTAVPLAIGARGPEKATAKIAIAPGGSFAVAGPFSDGARFQVRTFDRSGKMLAEVAPAGRGPGEVASVKGLFMNDTMVVVLTNPGMISMWTVAGKPIGDKAFSAVHGAVALVGDSLDLIDVPRMMQEGSVRVSRMSLATLKMREVRGTVVKAAEDVVSFASDGLPSMPAYASTAKAVVFGNPVSYRLLRVDDPERAVALGRALPPRKYSKDELAALEKELASKPCNFPANVCRQRGTPAEQVRKRANDSLPHFLKAGPGIDAAGRVALVSFGAEPRLELFTDRYLGAVRLTGCARAEQAALAGGSLLVLCATPESPDRDVELRAYTIR